MSAPVSARPLRRDAQRNRDRIVVAAREVFAERGIDAPVEEVARRAEVGVGTLYRRFPDKEGLIDAVFEDALAELAAIAEGALELPDAWEGFRMYLERVMALNAANRGLHAVMASREHGRDRLAAVRERMRPLVGRLIARAQAEGRLRPDFSPTDMPLLFAAVGPVMETARDSRPELWRRLLGVLLDGLRADGATPLPVPPLTLAQARRLRAPRPGKGTA